MKYIPLVVFCVLISCTVFAQEDENVEEVEITGEAKEDLLEELQKSFSTEKFKVELAMRACNCIDSISVLDKSRLAVSAEIGECIKAVSGAYLLGEAMSKAMFAKPDSNNTININVSDNSSDKKQAYFEIERILMDSCSEMQELIAASDKENINSVSDNREALALYNDGMDAFKKKNFKQAAKLYNKALAIDENFAFAWDNLGLTYRYMQKYDKALAAYQKSLKVSPKGSMPLQNIPIVYEYMKKPEMALDAYNQLTRKQPDNAEGYFGKGRILASMGKTTPALHSICQAYNIYKKSNNPYRTDAEKIMAYLYTDMGKTKSGKTKFYNILKQYDIKLKFED